MQRSSQRPLPIYKSINKNNNMKDESLENTIITLHGQGWSVRRISGELFISRKRIRRVLVSNSILRDTTPMEEITPKKKRLSKLDPYKEFIAELLDKYK